MNMNRRFPLRDPSPDAPSLAQKILAMSILVMTLSVIGCAIASIIIDRPRAIEPEPGDTPTDCMPR
jgi:hypothetical protein